MATFAYRCLAHGDVEVQRPVGTAPPRLACPTCGTPARRVFTAPLLTRTPSALATARDRAEASSETPHVVAAPPPRAARPRRPLPVAAGRLPRP